MDCDYRWICLRNKDCNWDCESDWIGRDDINQNKENLAHYIKNKEPFMITSCLNHVSTIVSITRKSFLYLHPVDHFKKPSARYRWKLDISCFFEIWWKFCAQYFEGSDFCISRVGWRTYKCLDAIKEGDCYSQWVEWIQFTLYWNFCCLREKAPTRAKMHSNVKVLSSFSTIEIDNEKNFSSRV